MHCKSRVSMSPARVRACMKRAEKGCCWAFGGRVCPSPLSVSFLTAGDAAMLKSVVKMVGVWEERRVFGSGKSIKVRPSGRHHCCKHPTHHQPHRTLSPPPPCPAGHQGGDRARQERQGRRPRRVQPGRSPGAPRPRCCKALVSLQQGRGGEEGGRSGAPARMQQTQASPIPQHEALLWARQSSTDCVLVLPNNRAPDSSVRC